MFDTATGSSRAAGPLEGLNAAQTEAATHAGGPLLVRAGAGTGKTRTVVARVANLIATGTEPGRILLLTFTRRAAREMLGRASSATPDDAARRVVGGTFHSVANRLLRIYGRAAGVSPDFTILDQADTADLIDFVRTDLQIEVTKARFPRKETLAEIYTRAVNSNTRLGEVLEHHFPWCTVHRAPIAAIFSDYAIRKRRGNMLDYDDLLLFWHALLAAPKSGEKIGTTFDHILVDEYQDTNLLQAQILKAMSVWCPNITVVGDDAQSIYSFRAATVQNILQFADEYPDARVVTLEQNYRSTQPILDACNAVIGRSLELVAKELFSNRREGSRPRLTTCFDDSEQAAIVCSNVLEHREDGVELKQQAVLFRAGHHSAALELELAARNIPFVKYGGLKFLETAHVKDVVSFLRLLENPWDEPAWFRVLQMLDGVGPAAARRMVGFLGINREPTDDDVARGAPTPVSTLLGGSVPCPAAARSAFDTFRDALRDCASGEFPVAVQIDRIRRFCEPLFERRYPAPNSRLGDLEQLAQIASGYPSRRAFLSDLILDPPVTTGDLAGPPLLDDDYLILSTIHSAKGSEWDVVHVIHAADGVIPSDMATGSDAEIEEELRLFYVALTRARNSLHVYFPLRYYHRPNGLEDAHGYAQVTRFLPPEVRSSFDRSVCAAPAELVAEATPRAGIVTVDARLNDLWS